MRKHEILIRLHRQKPVMLPSIVAKVLGISTRRVQQLLAAGRFPGALKFYRYWHIPRTAVEFFLASPPSKGGRPKRQPAVTQ